MMRMTAAEYRRSRFGQNKYSAKAIVEDGIRFDSKLERDRYLELRTRKLMGVVDYFLMQVPFRLPGGFVYRVDFQVFATPPCHQNDDCSYPTQLVTYEDCKGMMTPVSKMKIGQVEALYRVEIRIITRENLHA